MKRVSRRELARTITHQLVEGKDPSRVMLELAAYLLTTKTVKQADMVMSDIALAIQESTQHVSAEVISAFSLSADSLKQLESFVRQNTDAKTVELTPSQDKSLLGGVVVRTPGHEYDASIRRKLNKLAAIGEV